MDIFKLENFIDIERDIKNNPEFKYFYEKKDTPYDRENERVNLLNGYMTLNSAPMINIDNGETLKNKNNENHPVYDSEYKPKLLYSQSEEKLILRENILHNSKRAINENSDENLVFEKKNDLERKFNNFSDKADEKIFDESKKNLIINKINILQNSSEEEEDEYKSNSNERVDKMIIRKLPSFCDKNKIQFYYFEGNAKGMIIRAILDYTNVNWENKKISVTDWAKHKPEFEFKQLPVLNYDGKMYSQSFAIEFFLAKKFNLIGKGPEDEFFICSLLDIKNDLISKLLQIIYPVNETDSDFNNQQTNFEVLYNYTLPMFLKFFEAKLKENFCLNTKKNYVLESGFSLADITLTVLSHYIFKHPHRRILLEGLIDKYSPSLNMLINKIHSERLFKFFRENFITENAI